MSSIDHTGVPAASGGPPEAAALRDALAVLDAVPLILWTATPDGDRDFYNECWYEFTGARPGSAAAGGWESLLHPADRAKAVEAWSRTATGAGPYEAEYRLRHHSGEYRWMLARARRVRGEAGIGARWFGSCTDIHQLKLAEEQHELVAGELSHRIKNIFAVVSSLIHFSTRNAPKTALSFAQALSDRVVALATAHEYVRPHSRISAPNDSGRTVLGLARTLLSPYQDAAGERIRLSGDDAPIGSVAATALALVLHELATNAVKYGALSRVEGRVTLLCSEADGAFELIWTEIGGPLLDGPPARAGFGTAMALRAMRAQLDAAITSEWRRTGLVTRIVIPETRLAK